MKRLNDIKTALHNFASSFEKIPLMIAKVDFLQKPGANPTTIEFTATAPEVIF
jgi:hypothetical protein